jgi:hypothetical protein
MELEKNRQIQNGIIVHIRQKDKSGKAVEQGEYNLSGCHYYNPAALIKYLSHRGDTRKVDLSNSDIHKEVIDALAIGLTLRKIVIEELNLSSIEAIDDDLIDEISRLLFQQNHNGAFFSQKVDFRRQQHHQCWSIQHD